MVGVSVGFVFKRRAAVVVHPLKSHGDGELGHARTRTHQWKYADTCMLTVCDDSFLRMTLI